MRTMRSSANFPKQFAHRLRQTLELPNRWWDSSEKLARDITDAVNAGELACDELVAGAALVGSEIYRPDYANYLQTMGGTSTGDTGRGQELKDRLGSSLADKELIFVDNPTPNAASLGRGQIALYEGLFRLQNFFAASITGLPAASAALASTEIPLPNTLKRELSEGYRQTLERDPDWQEAPRDLIDFAILHEAAHEHFNDLGALEGHQALRSIMQAEPVLVSRIDQNWQLYQHFQEYRADSWAARELAELRQDGWAPFRGFKLLAESVKALKMVHPQPAGVDPHPPEQQRLEQLATFARHFESE